MIEWQSVRARGVLLGMCAVLVAFGVGCDNQKQAMVTPPAPGAAKKATPKKKTQPKEYAFVAESLTHTITPGQDAEVALRIKPGSGLKINPEFPWTWSGSASSGLTLATASLEKGQLKFTDAEASIPLKVRAGAPGEYTVTGKVNVSVCEKGGAQRCLWFNNQPVTIKVNAK